MSLIVYKSSAGSGKTSTLVIEYLSLALKKPNQFRQIIALTFTIKATNEIKDRVIQYLVQLKDMDAQNPSAKIDYVVKQIHDRTSFSAQEIKDRSQVLLQNILHQYGDFGFSTIDSFVVRLVRSFAHDLHLGSNFDIELDTQVFFDMAIEKLYEQIGKDKSITKFLLEYTLHQLENEKSADIEKPLTKLAKLIFDSKHYAQIDALKEVPIENFEKVRTILLATVRNYDLEIAKFGEEGMKFMADNAMEKDDTSNSWLNSYSNKLKTNHKDTYDLEFLENATFLKMVDGDNDWCTKTKAASIKSRVANAEPAIRSIIQEARQFYQKQLPLYLSHLMILNKITPLALIHELKQAIEDYSAENDIIHLSEANRKIAEVVNEQHAPFIYERIGQRYMHFLIDEFQDTSVIQWRNILPLLENSLASANDNLLVGDAKQSIYRWRDGDVEQFVNLPSLAYEATAPLQLERENMLKQSYKEIALDTNYRSQQNIITFNNTLFESLVENSTEYVQQFFQNHQQKSHDKSGEGLISMRYFAEGEDEPTVLDGIHDKIIELTQQQGFQPSDICILSVRNAVLVEIAEFLMSKGINVVSAEALLLYKSKSVNLLLSFMNLVIGHDISTHSYSILRFLKHQNSTQIIPTFDSTADFFTYLNELDYGFNESEMKQLDIYSLCEYIINKSKIENPSNPFLFKFLDLIMEQGKKFGASVGQFLDYWNSHFEKLSIDVSDDISAVQLLTVHKSKGLEFPVVFMPMLKYDDSLGDRTYLWQKSDESIEALLPTVLIGDESRGQRSTFAPAINQEADRKKLDIMNVTYVGCTRAEKQLHLFFTKEAKSKKLWQQFSAIPWSNSLDIISKDETSWVLGKAPEVKVQITDNEATNNEYLNKYIQNNWKQKIRLKRESAIPSLLKNRMEKGIQLHELLMKLRITSDVKQLIAEAIIGMTLSTDYQVEFENILQSLIAKADTARFFDSADIHIDEREILSPSGELLRPDKVIMQSDRSLVVDYKYADYQSISDQEKEKHLVQVQHYMATIQMMNSLPCQGYLLYLDGGIEVVEV